MQSTNHSSDSQLVTNEIQDAIFEERPISNTCARIIASWWHGGQASALYRFASTGAIDHAGMLKELMYCEAATPADQCAIEYLTGHIGMTDGRDERGDRGPVESWHEVSEWGGDA